LIDSTKQASSNGCKETDGAVLLQSAPSYCQAL